MRCTPRTCPFMRRRRARLLALSWASDVDCRAGASGSIAGSSGSDSGSRSNTASSRMLPTVILTQYPGGVYGSTLTKTPRRSSPSEDVLRMNRPKSGLTYIPTRGIVERVISQQCGAISVEPVAGGRRFRAPILIMVSGEEVFFEAAAMLVTFVPLPQRRPLRGSSRQNCHASHGERRAMLVGLVRRCSLIAAVYCRLRWGPLERGRWWTPEEPNALGAPIVSVGTPSCAARW